ncbi:hypothetical protein [Actinomadura fibrosa]|uniref:YbaB/EbfC family DNA-binding protein n=1 Tax=Actinomadura fibrosa TaxID=111802 RepID=A0ABW2XMS4_9ACTN|nr:hypothetical protein [Actinomadura fibrosa]
MPVRAVAVSEDERVRVTAADRRVEGIEVDARVLRLPLDEVAELLLHTVNGALERARPAAAVPDVPRVDVDEVRQALDRALDEGLVGMRRMTASLGEAVAQINRRANMRGSFEPPDLESLAERTRAVLDAARGGRPDGQDGQAEASAADGRVRVTVSWDGRVVRLVLESGIGVVDVTDGLRVAVNEALGEAEGMARRAVEPSPEFAEDVRAVQESGVRMLRDYAASLQDLMNSAEPK